MPGRPVFDRQLAPCGPTDDPRADLSRNLYIVRGVAIFLVVLSHVIGAEDAGILQMYKQDVLGLSLLNHFVYSFHVPLFFVASGVAFAAFGGDQTTPTRFMQSRFKRLVVPLLCWAPLSFVLRSSLRGRPFTWLEVLTQSILEPFFIFWFFHALLFASLFSFFSLRLFKSYGACLRLSVLLAIAAVCLNNLLHTQLLESSQFYLYWNVFYALGVFGAGHLLQAHTKLRKVSRKKLLCALGLCGLAMVVAQWLVPENYFMATRLINGTLAFGGLWAILTALTLGAPSGLLGSSLDRAWHLGRSSMAIYLFHVHFGTAVRMAIGGTVGFTTLALPLHLVLGCLIALGGPLALYAFLKPRSKAFAYSLGEGG